jgi:hypothetical protein
VHDYASAANHGGTSAIQRADPNAAIVVKAQPAGGAIATPQAIGQSNVSSIFWSIHFANTNGVNAMNFGFPDPVQVFSNSQVSVSMSEVDGNGTPFLALASMQVLNVVPQQDGTITVKYFVDWGSPIRVAFNFIIVN